MFVLSLVSGLVVCIEANKKQTGINKERPLTQQPVELRTLVMFKC